MSGWWCNVLDGGDRRVTYWILETPVSGWPAAIALLEIPMSGWMCNIVLDGGDTSVRMAICVLLCWRYQYQDGHCFVGDTCVGMDV